MRYFIVFYTAISTSGTHVGSISITSQSGFVNRKEAESLIIENNPNFSGVVLSNILELNSDDYEDWIK